MEIKVCPSTLTSGFETYSPQAIRKLFDGKRVSHIIDFGIDKFRTEQYVTDALNRISISGVQEKFPAVADGGKIRLAGDNEQSTYILKPAPWDDTIAERKQIPANENLTMQIASQVYGIRTAENGLCFSPAREIIYVTKRFDVDAGGDKYGMEDFSSLLGKTKYSSGINYKYTGSYEDIARVIRRYVPAWMVAMEEFFRIVVFNYIYGNGDAHLKNFSLMGKDGDYVLSPAYDLLNTCIHIEGDDFALCDGLSLSMPKSDVYSRTGHPCRKDFEDFGLLIGLQRKRTERILDMFSNVPELSRTLVANSFLSDKMKRKYILVVETRVKRFGREGN